MTLRIYIPAGGRGERFLPLTNERAKPAVPFGGAYRIIDPVLSNIANSGYSNIIIPTQYKHRSLMRHINRAWGDKFPNGIFVEAATMRSKEGDDWYTGTADSVWQCSEYMNIDLANQSRGGRARCAIFGADHIYKMDLRQLVEFFDHHRERHDAAGVVMVNKVHWSRAANQFGVVETDETGRIVGFAEKPANPARVPGEPEMCYASMGNYVWDTEFLLGELEADSKDVTSKHDFGKNIIPNTLEGKHGGQTHPLYAYAFNENSVPGMQENERGYWEDVGSIDAYYESNRHVMARHPVFDLYNSRWPLHTLGTEAPPAKYVGDASEPCTTYGSLISNGWIISKAAVEDSLLFTCHDEMGVYSQGRAYGKVEKGAEVCESLLFGPNLVHHGAKVLRTILEKGVDVPEGVHTGHRLHWPRERKDEAIARDTARGFTISEGGVTVVPKGYVFR